METWTEFVMLQLGRFNSSDLKQTTVTRTKQKRKKIRPNEQNKSQHVSFIALYNSQPSSAKQQREITTICVVCEQKPRRQIIFNFHLELKVKKCLRSLIETK